MHSLVMSYTKRILSTSLGLAVCAYGIGMTVAANLGLGPWDVFHQGIALQLSKILGREIMMGTVSQISGVVVLIAVIALREKIGIATLLDIYLYGECLNVYMKYNLLPVFENVPARLAEIVIGYLIWGVGVYIYMKPQLGAGPRDSLMVALAKKNIPINMARNLMEFVVFIIGWIAGGTVGIGTVISVVIMGYVLKVVFGIFKFDVTKVKNESLIDTAKRFKKLKA